MHNEKTGFLKVNGEDFSITPSDIKPSVEILKTSERSISGKLCVDYIGEKINLELVWNLLTNEQLETIKKAFVKGKDSVKLTYLNQESNAPLSEGANDSYYFDGISYTPIFVQDKLQWQGVTVRMLQM